jgi:hypothetical protein
VNSSHGSEGADLLVGKFVMDTQNANTSVPLVSQLDYLPC